MRKTRSRVVDNEEALRAVKREKASVGGGGGGDGDGGDRVDAAGDDESTRESRLDRRVLRSKYLAVMNMIKGTEYMIFSLLNFFIK